jgi:uncharacterized membrane protein
MLSALPRLSMKPNVRRETIGMDMDTFGLVLAGIGLIFWLWQLISVAFTDGRYLRSPLHKLICFVVVAFVPVIGALAFFIWKRQAVARVEAETREHESMILAKAYTGATTSTAEPRSQGSLTPRRGSAP